MSKEAMKLALEALVLNNKEWKALADSGDSGCWSAEDQDHYKQANEAIKALEEALAKQACALCNIYDQLQYGYTHAYEVFQLSLQLFFLSLVLFL